MKCETACNSLNRICFSGKSDASSGGRFRDEREYLEFLLEQERAWEDEHLEYAASAYKGGS